MNVKISTLQVSFIVVYTKVWERPQIANGFDELYYTSGFGRTFDVRYLDPDFVYVL